MNSTDTISYRQAARAAQAGPLLVLAVVARMASGLVPFGIVASLSSRHALAEAGIASGLYLLTSAFAGPVKGRLIDRHGGRILPVFALAFLGLTTACALLAPRAEPIYIVLLAPVVALAAPPAAPVIRTLWSRIATNDQTRRRLHALDSVLEESTFAITPLLVSLVWLTIGPAWAVLAGGVTAALGAVGILAYANHRGHQLGKAAAAIAPRKSRSRRLPLKIWCILLPMLALGSTMGAVGAVSPAWAGLSVGQEFSGVLAALISMAGVAAGLLHGRLKTVPHHSTQYLIAGVLLVLGTAAFAAGTNPLFGVFGALFIGAAMTPMFTEAYLLVPELIPDTGQTQANSTIGSSFNLSAAAGAAAAGLVASAIGPQLAFATVAVSSLAMTALAALCWRRERASSTTTVPNEELSGAH